MHRSPIKGKARSGREGPSRYRAREEKTRNIPDQMIRDFVARMHDYADEHGLGKPNLLFGQTSKQFGVCLDWRDYRRSFTFTKGSWTVDDYTKLCDALRSW
jgi:hypothetical protein